MTFKGWYLYCLNITGKYMTKRFKFTTATLIAWIILSVAITACSSNGGNEPYTFNVETESENITSLGEFPVGIRDYAPPVIDITSPVSLNPVTTITDDVNGYLREIVKGEKWALDIKGKVTPSTFGVEKSPLEFKGVYVNWELVDAGNGDDIKWVDGKFTFTKTVFITKEDLAKTFYPIVVAAVDEKGFVAGAKSVVILQDKAANSFGVPLANSLHLSGNKEFVSNALSMLVSQIDGLNLAPNMPKATILGLVDVLVPRTGMLQGVEISDYSISSNGAGLCSVNLNIKISNLVVEYTNNLSIFKKGQNIININMKNVEIDGLIVELSSKDGVISASLKAGDIALVKGAGFKFNLDTPFIGIFNYLLDNVFSFLIQDVFNKLNQKPVQLKIGYNALKLLINQLSGNTDPSPVNGLKYCTENNGGVRLGMDMTSKIVTRLEGKLKSTYSSSKAKSDKIDLAINNGNSSIALSDDYLNQVLAMTFLSDPDTPQEITKLDLNELIKQMDINLGDYELWPWLRDSNDKLPKIKIKFLMLTPPVLKIHGDGNYIGSLNVKNILVEVYELDNQDKEKENGLLARLSIDLGIAMKWENGKFVLECGKEDASYTLLFNKLYPLLLPPQMKEIHIYIANSLNQLLSKIELIGYPVKNVSTLNDAYLVFNGSLLHKDKIETNEQIETYYSRLWNKSSLSSSQGTDSRMINDKIVIKDELPENDIFISLFFKSIDDSGNLLTDLDWNDSCGYFYDFGENSNKLITGISFNRDIMFDLVTGNTLEFYEEFAVMSIAYGNAAPATGNEEYIPGEGCLIPYDLTIEDMSGIEFHDYLTYNIPFSTNVGIGIRVKKDPSILLKLNPVVLKMASASNIKIEYVDLSLNLGLNF
jgi:hypothetical protein